MANLLYVRCSPRGEASKTTEIARAFLDAWQDTHPDGQVEEMDLYHAGLPEYAAEGAIAKMSHFGEGELAGEVARAWAEIKRIIAHFDSFDEYLLSVPMWNFSVPYKLKQYFDILSQPGLTFGFDPAIGYIGLLKNKRATGIYSAGIYHAGASKAYGTNHCSTLVEDFLNFTGISDVTTIWYEKYKMVEDPDALMVATKALAQAAARRPRD